MSGYHFHLKDSKSFKKRAEEKNRSLATSSSHNEIPTASSSATGSVNTQPEFTGAGASSTADAVPMEDSNTNLREEGLPDRDPSSDSQFSNPNNPTRPQTDGAVTASSAASGSIVIGANPSNEAQPDSVSQKGTFDQPLMNSGRKRLPKAEE